MAKLVLLTTTELAAQRGVTRQAILMRIQRGTLTPTITLANGHYLFDASKINGDAA